MGGGYWKKGKEDENYTESFLIERATRLLPLFFVSLTSLLIAGLVVKSFELDAIQYCSSLVGLGWFFPPMVPTLWFCSIMIFYSAISGLLFSISNLTRRKIIVVAVYVAILLLGEIIEIDERVVLYYPAFFINFFFSEGFFEERSRKKVCSLLLYIDAALIIPLIWLVYRSQCYSEFSLEIRIILDSICVGAIIFFSRVIAKIFSNIPTISCFFAVLSKATFCAYLFHRQFYEVVIIFFGKLSKIAGWFFVMDLFIVSYVIQKMYNYICRVLEQRIKTMVRSRFET